MTHFYAGARATLPVLLGIVPFGVITGVAMVASAQLGVRLAIGYLTADNVYGLMLNRFAEHCVMSPQLCSPPSGLPKCWCKMNNCRPALSQFLWRGAGA